MSETMLYPAKHYPLVTPNDSTDVSVNDEYPRGLSVQVAGAVVVEDLDGETQTFTAEELPVGVIHAIRVQKVLATGTTATGIRLYF